MFVKLHLIQQQVKENTEYKNKSEPDKNKALVALLKNNALLEQVLEEQKAMKQEIHALKIELENLLALNPDLRKPLKQ
jgi:hypothetical protein